MSPKKKMKAGVASDPLWLERLNYFESRQDALVQTIRSFVEIESPSDNKQAVDRMGAFLAGTFEAIGGKATIHRAEEYGDNLQIDFPGDSAAFVLHDSSE